MLVGVNGGEVRMINAELGGGLDCAGFGERLVGMLPSGNSAGG